MVLWLAASLECDVEDIRSRQDLAWLSKSRAELRPCGVFHGHVFFDSPDALDLCRVDLRWLMTGLSEKMSCLKIVVEAFCVVQALEVVHDVELVEDNANTTAR